MKKLVTVTEVAGEGFEALLGEDVLIFCVNYIYAGKLIGVNEEFVQIENAKLVYETGSFSEPGYKDAQKLPKNTWNIQKSAIESFGLGK